MTEHHPETILATAEHIRLGFNVTAAGDVGLTLWAVCTPPVGPIRILITPVQAAALCDSLNGINNLTPEQTEHLAVVVAAAATKEN